MSAADGAPRGWRSRHLARGSRIGSVTLAVLLWACGTPLSERPEIGDPAAVAREARGPAERERPAVIRFEWYYSDERGDVRGEGVGRYNPPDSVRLDLFTSGDVSSAVALTGTTLRAREEIEDVELPGATFLYAMAGFFRPPAESPAAGYRVPEGTALRYRSGPRTVQDFYLENHRLVRVEEREDGHLLRRVRVTWDTVGEWPRRAGYRDFTASRRVRWTLTRAEGADGRFPTRIFELPERTRTHE